jgi:tryptophan halogenase
MKIVIVGGGSAGWMSASMLIKEFPNYEIVLVESPDTPTVGVGESTINGIKQFCNYLGINEKEFLSFTDGSYKLAIQFKDFDKLNSRPFLYPFGHPVVGGTNRGVQDWLIKKYVLPETPVQDLAESFFPAALMVKHGVFFNNLNYSVVDGFNQNIGVAYHFDATKFAFWLRDHYALPKGVTHVIDHVSQIDTENRSVSRLVLKSGQVISGDLYVDCTGFSSKLLGEALQEEFIDYSDLLPNNRAWATQVKYIDKEKELKPVTTCTAIQNGWVWDIPLWSRIGTGYVYSDKFITPEDALEEFKNYLQSDKVDCPKSKEQIDTLVFKDVKMRVGIHKKTWVGNTVAIGLSAGFIEPLESSGLYTVHEFLFQLVRALSRGNPSAWDIETYNTAIFRLFNEFAEFVALHYALTKRDDTEYWRAITRKDFMAHAKEHPSFFSAIVDSKTRLAVTPDRGGYPWVLVGMGYLGLDKVSGFLLQADLDIPVADAYMPEIVFLTKRKEHWESKITGNTSLYKYLKNNIYFE